MSLSALIVDDHPIIRDALVNSLVALNVFDQVETVDCFGDLLQKLEIDATYRLLILDLSLADVSGSHGVVYVREQYPEIPVMIFSASDSPDVIAQCFELGVQGFVSKSSSMQIFVNAIRVVLAGGIYIPPSAAPLMGIDPSELAGSNLQPVVERVKFTPKQQMVFEQLMQGVPNKIIARRLNMAEGTVKTHLHGIYQLLRIHNRAQAILRARELQLID